MTLPIVFLPLARRDVLVAIEQYERARPGLGTLFHMELNRTIGLIAQWPGAYQHLSERLRRVPLHGFSELVIYEPLSTHIRVVGVVSARRDPAFVASLDQP
jgi:hypothetical protein